MIGAVSMCRDEDDIIGPVVEHMFAEGVDRIWVADNLSADKTRPILDELAGRYPLTIIEDAEPGFYQAAKMTNLAHVAIDAGADWVVPFDADEWFYSTAGTIADTLRQTPPGVVLADGWDHLPRHDDPDDPNPIARMGWRRPHHQKFPKVIFSATAFFFLHQGQHGIEHPGPRTGSPIEYRHYQYRTLEQMVRKVRQGTAAYAASNVDGRHGTHWKDLAALSDEALAAEWDALCADPDVMFDPAPR